MPETQHTLPKISMTWPQYKRGECTYDGEVVPVGRISGDVLFTLLVNRGRVITLTELITCVYGLNEPENAEESLYVLISRMRKKIPGIITSGGNRAHKSRDGVTNFHNTAGYVIEALHDTPTNEA